MDVTKPKISVIMSVYNEPLAWLKQSIESILCQSFQNFEFIIVLDNPNNREIREFITSYRKRDSRIIFLENNENLGLAKSLNRALYIARGKYIARMDGDDISLPNRLEKQYKFLERNKEIDLVGSWVYKMDQQGTIYGIMRTPAEMRTIKKNILYRSVAFHPTWMVKKEIYENLDGYRPFIVAQDYEFLLRVLDHGFKISNIQEPLLRYRINLKNLSSRKAIYQYKSALYALELHKRRRRFGYDNFSEEEYLKYLKTSKIIENIHSFSTKMFVKAMNSKDKNNYLLLGLYLLISLLSPYQVRRIFSLMRGKFLC